MTVRRCSGALALGLSAALLSTAAIAGTTVPEIPDVLTLDWSLARARAANPDLERARAQAEAAGHRVRPAGSLEDPRFAYEASNIPVSQWNFSSTPMSGQQLGLRQKLPFPGLLSSRADAERHAAEAADRVADDEQLRLEGRVEATWAELGFAQRALEITERNIALLRQLAATAANRYRVGTGIQADVLRAQVELTSLLEERLARQEAIARAEASLGALLDLGAAEPLPLTAELAFDAAEPSLESVLAAFEERSPRLAAARERVESARRRVHAAQYDGYPDVDLGVGYRLREPVMGDPVPGDDFVSAGLTVRLPVDRGKWRAHVAEQRALLRHAEADLRSTRADLLAMAQRAHAALRRAYAEESLLETGLVPQARQSLEASRSAYEVGRIGFLSLLDSQVRLLEAELRLVRTRADKRVAFASLESAAGGSLR